MFKNSGFYRSKKPSKLKQDWYINKKTIKTAELNIYLVVLDKLVFVPVFNLRVKFSEIKLLDVFETIDK